MIEMAIKEILDANSYRNFLVGASELIFHNGIYQVFSGHNIKLSKGFPKHCAEKDALIKACDHHFFGELVAVVVASDERQRDELSGKNPSTLHPCPTCRAMFGDLKDHVTRGTIFYMTDLAQINTQEYSFEELVEYHNDDRIKL